MDTQIQSSSCHNSYGGISSTEISSVSEDEEGSSGSTHTSEEEEGFSYRRLSRRHKSILASICTTSMIIMMSESIMSPLYPEETELRGISTTVSGWVFAAYALGQVLFAPLIAKYLPKIGARFVYLSGVFFAGGCTLLFGILEYIPVADGQTVFVAFCFVMQIVLSVGVTAQQTATFTMASREFSNYFTAVFALTEVFVGLGMTIGPAIGGFLYTIGGFHLPFVVVGALIISSLPFNYCLLPSRSDDEERQALLSTNDEIALEKNKGKSATRIILSDPTAIVTLLSVTLGSGVWSVLDPILEPRLSEFGLTPELSGVIFLILSASYALSSPIASWVADRISDNRTLMIPGFVICAVSHLLLGSSPLIGFDPDYKEIWLTILALITLGFAISMAVIPSYEIILDVATDNGLEDNMETNAAVAGIWCAMYAVGDFIGPVYGGWMLETGGFSWTLTYTGICAGLMAIMLLVSAIYDKRCRKYGTSSSDVEKGKSEPLTSGDGWALFASVYVRMYPSPFPMT